MKPFWQLASWCVLCLSSKCCTCINSSILPKTHRQWVILLSCIFPNKKWRPERLIDLPKFTQLVKTGSKIWAVAVWFQSMLSLPPYYTTSCGFKCWKHFQIKYQSGRAKSDWNALSPCNWACKYIYFDPGLFLQKSLALSQTVSYCCQWYPGQHERCKNSFPCSSELSSLSFQRYCDEEHNHQGKPHHWERPPEHGTSPQSNVNCYSQQSALRLWY